jgi:hypothetical protein
MGPGAPKFRSLPAVLGNGARLGCAADFALIDAVLESRSWGASGLAMQAAYHRLLVSSTERSARVRTGSLTSASKPIGSISSRVDFIARKVSRVE